MWICYRVATKQLNLYHAGRTLGNSCCKLLQCKGSKETALHIFWECSTAQACCIQLISHWTGKCATYLVTSNLFSNCGNSQAPPIPRRLSMRLQHRFQGDSTPLQQNFGQIWFFLSSICQEHLWSERNAVVFGGFQTSPSASVNHYWERGIRQLETIAIREHRATATAVCGARLHTCLELLIQKPYGYPPYARVSHDLAHVKHVNR